MIIVLDAAAVVDLLVRSQQGERVRSTLAQHRAAALLTVAHLDAEVFSALARIHRGEQLAAEQVTVLLGRLASLAVLRLPITVDLTAAAWALRGNISARDGLYVAAARSVGGHLLTTDARLARSLPELMLPLE